VSPVQQPAAVPRTLGLIDLVLLKVVAIVNVNNVPPTAVFGRASLLLWVLAFVAFFIPEALAVMVMVRRYPGEGGIYLWTRRLFGEGHGFFSGWCYWVNNLFYVPVLLVYIAGVAAFAAGERGAALIDRPWFAASVAFGWLIAMTVANVRGLAVGKWIQNIGGIGTALVVLLVVVAALAEVASGGTLVPPPADGTGWEMAAGFSVMCFAFVGIELASTMGDEIRNPQRDLPRAIAISGAIAIGSYLLVTGAVQALVPVRELGPIQGIMQAVAHGASLAGIRWIVAPIAVVMALSVGGAASAWFAGSSRVPFAAGLAHALPQALGRVHPRWGSPHVALITCAVLAALFATLSFVGSTVNEAYQVLLKASVAIQLVPFIYLFLGTMKLEGVGGLTRAAGGLGLLVTIAGTFAAFLPPADVASVWVFELKMLAGVGGPSAVGWLLYWRTTRRARADLAVLAAGGAVPSADAPRADASVR
jgi:glutamate:GABA antiporter